MHFIVRFFNRQYVLWFFLHYLFIWWFAIFWRQLNDLICQSKLLMTFASVTHQLCLRVLCHILVLLVLDVMGKTISFDSFSRWKTSCIGYSWGILLAVRYQQLTLHSVLSYGLSGSSLTSVNLFSKHKLLIWGLVMIQGFAVAFHLWVVIWYIKFLAVLELNLLWLGMRFGLSRFLVDDVLNGVIDGHHWVCLSPCCYFRIVIHLIILPSTIQEVIYWRSLSFSDN